MNGIVSWSIQTPFNNKWTKLVLRSSATIFYSPAYSETHIFGQNNLIYTQSVWIYFGLKLYRFRINILYVPM